MKNLKVLSGVIGGSLVALIIGIIMVLFASNISYLLAGKSIAMFADEDKYVNGDVNGSLTTYYQAAVDNTANNVAYIDTAVKLVGTVLTFASLIVLISVLFGKGGILAQIRSMGSGGREGFN